MHGAAVREHPRQLVVVHARPVPDAAGVEMHEGRARRWIEADAAALQAKPGVADLLQRYAGNEEIHRVAQHVLAGARHAGGAAAQHRVGCGGTVGRNNLDGLFGIDVAGDFPEDVEQPAVHIGLVLAAPVAEEVVDLLHRVFVVSATALERDGQVFAGMGVVEGQRTAIAQRSGVMHRTGPGHQQHRRHAGMKAGARRQRCETACEDSQHV